METAEEIEKQIEEYRKKIKKKTDRELMESIAMKLKYLELNIENMSERLAILSKVVLHHTTEENSNDEEEFDDDNEENNEEEEKQKEQMKEMQEKVEKMERYQKSFCKKCGAKLKDGFFDSGKCPNCDKKKYLTTI